MMWVTQFGLSALFPLCAFLLIGAWLQNKFGLSPWFTMLCGILGLLTSIRTVRSCYKSLRKDADILEELTDKSYWPYPTYSDILFY